VVLAFDRLFWLAMPVVGVLASLLCWAWTLYVLLRLHTQGASTDDTTPHVPESSADFCAALLLVPCSLVIDIFLITWLASS
jgi:hypothetical protein